MATPDRLDDYELFYQEIPANDYFETFDIKIEDHLDEDGQPSLTADQVSRLAIDSQEDKEQADDRAPSAEDPSLFDDEEAA